MTITEPEAVPVDEPVRKRCPRTTDLGADPRLAAQVRELLHQWRTDQGTRPSPIFEDMLAQVRRWASFLQLRSRARRRLFALCAEARKTSQWQRLATIMDGSDRSVIEFILFGHKDIASNHGRLPTRFGSGG